MPDRVEPALALLKLKLPAENQWSYEIKWDGYRTHVHVEPGRVRVLTEGGHDWSHQFPAIVEAAKALRPATMFIDSEAVMLDEQGRSDFDLLQSSLGALGRLQGKETSPAEALRHPCTTRRSCQQRIGSTPVSAVASCKLRRRMAPDSSDPVGVVCVDKQRHLYGHDISNFG